MKQNRLPDYKRCDDPSIVGTLINAGIDKCLDLKYGEGIANFNQALELVPENFDALYNKAIASLKWGFDDFIIGSKRYASGIKILSRLPYVGEDTLHETKGFLEDFFNITRRRL